MATRPSALTALSTMLNSLGLGALGDRIWTMWKAGVPPDEIMSKIRSSDVYQQRFPGMAALAKSGHAISEAEYIAKETADISLLHAYGVDNMARRDFLGRLISNQVSTTELQQRLDAYSTVVNQLPSPVKDYLGKMGVHSGDLIGYWLNPDEALPAIQQKVQAAEVGGAAQLAGFGMIDPRQAARLAGLGVSYTQALAGFEKEGELAGLTQNLPGQVPSAVSRDTLTNAVLGQDAGAALTVQKEQDRRLAQFKDQESFATSSSGVSGLGVAET